uniref:Ig-like domain-containing protein n=1 Tax=Astyanax mexicanus TaxID=7994 RepID=A0A8B9GX13_ASTMX
MKRNWIIDLIRFSHSDQVTQTPLHLIRNHDVSVTIECSHTVSGYNQINWYKQTNGEGLALIGYLYATGTPQIEKDFQNKTGMSGNGGSRVVLTIKDLSASDSAVYFCAASYTVLQSCSTAIQKCL